MSNQIFGVGFDVPSGNGIGEQEFEQLIIVYSFATALSKPLPETLAMFEMIRFFFHELRPSVEKIA